MPRNRDDYDEMIDDYEEMEEQDISAVSLSHNIRNEYIGQGTKDDYNRPVFTSEANQVFSWTCSFRKRFCYLRKP